MAEREVVQDPNAPARGNAPAQQLAVQGIMSPRGAPRQDNSLENAIASFGAVAKKMENKKKAADFIDGKMAAMSGKTQAEVAETGNRTTMAGFVGMDVTNAVSRWANEQQAAAASEHYGTDPAAYNKHLSEQAAGLIAEVGDDDYAQEVLAQTLAPTMERLAAAQSGAHAQYVEQETLNSYTNSLFLSGQYSAAAYQDPVTGEASKGGDYRAYASGLINTLIGVESAHNPNAKNPNSSAEGLGQFINSTWLTTVKRYSPNIAAGKSDAEILAMKTNPLLSKRMAIEYAAEQARGLAASGLPVTPGNTYLAYFAGPGGAKRVLRGDPNASVATTLTRDQINANKSVVYKGGRLITNSELQQWAARKMGAAPAASAQTKAAVLTNPGLSPDKHRAAVTAAMVSSLQAGDQSLYQSVGGIDGMKELNLSMGQINSITAAHKAANDKSQNDYNMEYERARHNFLTEAASGKYTEDEMFERLAEFQSKNSLNDTEMRRLHQQMQSQIDAEDKATAAANKAIADDAAKEAEKQAAGVWNTVDGQIEVMTYKEHVRNGTMSADDAIAEMIEIGEMRGASPEATEKAVAKILGVYESVKGKERTRMETAIKEGQKVREIQTGAARLLGQNALGTGTKQEQEAGIALMEETLREELADLPPQEQAEEGQKLLAQALVQNDIVDPKRASTMRAAMNSPAGADGKPTTAAIEAMSFFLDLKHNGNAPPEYLAKMFKGSPKTLEVLLTAEQHMVGDAGMDDAIIRAHEQVNNPITQARIAEANRAIDSGELQQRVKESIISNSGLDNTVWNRFMHTFDKTDATGPLDDSQIEDIMADSGLGIVIDQEARSAVALYPNASQETIAQIVSAQVAERGAILGGSYVVAPMGKTVKDMMGLASTDPDDMNTALITYVANHGAELFGADVWEDFGPNVFGGTGLKESLNQRLGAGMMLKSVDEARAEGMAMPDLNVELVGDMFRITPASGEFEDDIFFDDYASLPQARSVFVPASEIGAWFNKNQTTARIGAVNTAVDVLKPVDSWGNRNVVNPLRDLFGQEPIAE